MKTRRTLYGLLLAVPLMLLGIGTAIAEDQADPPKEKEKPSGTIVIDETQVMFILGGEKGGGVLRMGDMSYSFKTGGLKVGGIGIHKMHLVGDVYGLNDVKDFAGTYFEKELGITVGEGKGSLWLSNDKGVKIHVKANSKGLALSTGVSGLKITMN